MNAATVAARVAAFLAGVSLVLGPAYLATPDAHAARMDNFNPAAKLDTSQVVAGEPVVWRCYASEDVTGWRCTAGPVPFPGELVYAGDEAGISAAWDMTRLLIGDAAAAR